MNKQYRLTLKPDPGVGWFIAVRSAVDWQVGDDRGDHVLPISASARTNAGLH
jgi:hypothetical protein